FRFKVVMKLAGAAPGATTDWKKCRYYQRFKLLADLSFSSEWRMIGKWTGKEYHRFIDLDKSRTSGQPELEGTGLTEGYAEDWRIEKGGAIVGPTTMKTSQF